MLWTSAFYEQYLQQTYFYEHRTPAVPEGMTFRQPLELEHLEQSNAQVRRELEQMSYYADLQPLPRPPADDVPTTTL